MKPFRAPPRLPDLLVEEAGSENRWYKQVKDTRPFAGIVNVNSSDELSDQTRLSILSWNAGPERDRVAHCVVGSVHVPVLQEAESYFQEIVTSAEQQFHV